MFDLFNRDHIQSRRVSHCVGQIIRCRQSNRKETRENNLDSAKEELLSLSLSPAEERTHTQCGECVEK